MRECLWPETEWLSNSTETCDGAAGAAVEGTSSNKGLARLVNTEPPSSEIAIKVGAIT
jgi:hypothetical protein